MLKLSELNYRTTTLLEQHESSLTPVENTGKHKKRMWIGDVEYKGTVKSVLFIELTKGYYTITDTYNLADVIVYNWHSTITVKKDGLYVRVSTHARSGDKRTPLYLHQHLTGLGFGGGCGVAITADHQDQQPLNNLIINLKAATKHQQMLNRTVVSLSGYRGVKSHHSKYAAQLRIPNKSGKGRGKRIQTSVSDTPEQAALLYNFLALSLIPEFPLDQLNEI